MIDHCVEHLLIPVVKEAGLKAAALGDTHPAIDRMTLGQITDPLTVEGDTVLAASNYRWPPEGIRLWVSRDRGMTWPVEESVQMWDSARKEIVADAMPVGDRLPNEGVWDALPTFTFGTPHLKCLADGTFLLTYYAQVDGTADVRACRFSADLE